MPFDRQAIGNAARNPWVWAAGAGGLALILLTQRQASVPPAVESQVNNAVLPDETSGGRGAIAGMGMLPEWTLDGRGVRLTSGEESVEVEPPNVDISYWERILRAIREQFGTGGDVHVELPGGSIDIDAPIPPPSVIPSPATPSPAPLPAGKPKIERPINWMPGIIDDTPPPDVIPVPSLPGPSNPIASGYRTLYQYFTAMATSPDQTSFLGRVRNGLWTAQSSHIGNGGSHWITLELAPGAWTRYQPDMDKYRWGYSTWQNAESSWNRVNRWAEEIMSAHPTLDPQKVLYYQIGRLRRNAEERGIPLSQLGFQGIERIPSANGKSELGL